MATVNANFGTVEYRDGGVITIPLTFTETDVIVPSKSICRVTHVSGSELTGVNYRMIGKGRAFETVVEMPPNRKGSFSVAITGTVLNASTREWDTVSVAAKTVTYDTRVPVLKDFDIPANYNFGEKFYVLVAFTTVVTGWHLNNTITQIFIEEGTRIGTPTPYKWIGTNPPDIHAPVTGELSTDKRFIGTNWERLSAPPAGAPTPGTNGFSNDGEEWHGESGQYFLISFEVSATARGTFNLTLRQPSILRGPVN